MKNIISKFLSVVILSMSFAVVAEREPTVAPDGSPLPVEERRGFIELHNAMESESLRISLGSDMHGFIEGKVCDLCETIKVTITPDTKAYSNDVEVPLKKAKSRLGRYATVIYELETKNVSAIRW